MISASVPAGSRQRFRGTLEPDLSNDDDDPNLRFSSDTGSRVTDSQIIAIGGDWNGGRWSVSAEYAMTTSDTSNPNLSTTLNFINPNCPLDASSNDNCVPFIYDLSGGTLSWGVNFDSPFAPAPADLLDPANVVLDQVIIGRNTTENEEDALRMDFSWDADWNGITTLDFGFRYGESSSRFNRIQGPDRWLQPDGGQPQRCPVLGIAGAGTQQL